MSYTHTTKSREGYLQRKFLISKSDTTRESYGTALNVFDHFTKDVYQLNSGDTMIEDLKKLSGHERAVYDMLQSFVDYLTKDRNPRPVLMKDFFDKDLVTTIHELPTMKVVQIGWNAQESSVPL